MLLALVFIAASPSPYACPTTITTKQSLRDVPKGFEPFIDTANTRHRLDGVDFYDGPPTDLAVLKPDNGDEQAPPYWTFSRAPGRPIWQVCSYTQTAVKLARKVPDEIKKCKVLQGRDEVFTVKCE